MADSQPLAMEPFEKYMLWDDTPVAPMTPTVEMDFDSDLDASTLSAAFDSALPSHPLLCSRVQEQPDGRLVWQLVADDERPRIAIAQFPEAELRPIDLRRDAGLRAWLFPSGTGFRLRLQWHHACCDGVGMRAFVVALLIDYHHRTGGSNPKRRPEFAPELLSARGDFSNVQRQESIGTLQRLRNAHYFHCLLPVPLHSAQRKTGQGRAAKSQSEGRQTHSFPVHLDIDREASSKIIHQCKSRGIGISTLAAGLLFRQCRDWNTARGDRARNARMRLVMPYDLRNSRQLRMSAANRMSFAFIGRKYQDTHQLSTLLLGLQAELAQAKRTQLPLDFLAGLTAASRSARAMRWMLSGRKCMATAVLTYAGDTTRGLGRSFTANEDGVTIGNCRLLRIGGAPPARMQTNIAIGLCNNWGRLCFSASYCAAQFSREDCEQFLEQYIAQWMGWIENR